MDNAEKKEPSNSGFNWLVILFVLGIFSLVVAPIFEGASKKYKRDEIYSKYENSKDEADFFAVKGFRRCLSDGENRVDCQIKVSVLAEQQKGNDFKLKVAKSLSNIIDELQKVEQ